jgi:HupF/HypC family
MCLAIPGKIIEISSENHDSAVVEVIGVRRRIDLGLLQDDKQDQRTRCYRPDEYPPDAGRNRRSDAGSPRLRNGGRELTPAPRAEPMESFR